MPLASVTLIHAFVYTATSNRKLALALRGRHTVRSYSPKTGKLESLIELAYRKRGP